MKFLKQILRKIIDHFMSFDEKINECAKHPNMCQGCPYNHGESGGYWCSYRYETASSCSFQK